MTRTHGRAWSPPCHMRQSPAGRVPRSGPVLALGLALTLDPAGLSAGAQVKADCVRPVTPAKVMLVWSESVMVVLPFVTLALARAFCTSLVP